MIEAKFSLNLYRTEYNSAVFILPHFTFELNILDPFYFVFKRTRIRITLGILLRLVR